MTSDHGRLEISNEEWMRELDALRDGQFVYTDEQMQFVIYARRGDRPVPWESLARAFKSRFKWGSATTMRRIYAKAEEDGLL